MIGIPLCAAALTLAICGCGGLGSEGRSYDYGPDSARTVRDSTGLEWIVNDYGRGLAEARRSGRPLFVDYSARNSTDCRWMERKMFTRPEVVELLRGFVLVRLYTERKDSLNRAQRQMVLDRYHTAEIPYYAVVNSRDSTLATTGWMRSPAEFRLFLLKGL